MNIEKYTIGVGDRFGHQAPAQLEAFIAAADTGIPVVPVWNKSNREHTIIGSEPSDVRANADAAVAAAGWTRGYHVDADHIGLKTVDRFLDASDFYTIDVADFTGQAASAAEIGAFVARHADLVGDLVLPGRDEPVSVTVEAIRSAAEKFLLAMIEAGKVYRHIEAKEGAGNFIVEVSVDETDLPQSPTELLLILRMIADQGIPAQTIAPKFTGRFNKGVDYVGDLGQFEREFDDDLAVIAYAVESFGLPSTLKLSVHSGSDKFSLYPIINRLIKEHGAGLHLKTAGTNWLEEVIGLAESDGDGLAIAKEIYRLALPRYDELVAPYAPVVDIDPERLPAPKAVDAWDAATYAETLRHDQQCPRYNLHFRQFIHVAFKIAAELGPRYHEALDANREIVTRNVRDNLLDRHITPIFQGL
jgi:hypothetical protein